VPEDFPLSLSSIPLVWPPAPSHRLNPPSDHYYASALWLCGRHPKLVELVERAGVVVDDEDGRWFELDALADALADLDAYLTAWQLYRDRTYEPREEAAWERWEAAGPTLDNPAAVAIAPMSRTEQSRLRLLAFFASTRVGLRVSDLGGLDDEGRLLLHDWTLAVVKA
jgi:hypothetical protein